MYLQRPDSRLYAQSWLVEQPRALVVISHGLGEHGGRYAHVAEYLNVAGFAVYALDHRGHGQSEGQRGHIESFRLYGEDLHVFIGELRERHPGLALHLLGHSMGGLIASAYVLRYSGVTSLVLSAPAYAACAWHKQLQVYLGQYLAVLLPRMGMSNGINAAAISRSDAVVQAYVNDPLVHDRVSPAWGAAFYREQQFIAGHANRLSLPVLMLLAGADRLTDSRLSQRRFQQFASCDKQLEIYADAFHEILNEQDEQPLALAAIVDWLLRHP